MAENIETQQPSRDISGDLTLTCDIEKTDPDQRLVFGWLYVHRTKEGRMVVDHSGEIIRMPALERASYNFVLKHRNAGKAHQETSGIGDLVECVVFTPEKRKAMGIPDGIVPDGIWVGFKIQDDDTWAGIKSGKYKMLSLGGKAIKRAIRSE